MACTTCWSSQSLLTSFRFPDHQLILPVKELSSGDESSVIDLVWSLSVIRYPLSVNSYSLIVLISELGAIRPTLLITNNCYPLIVIR
jgi:hypothetical protein